MNRFVQQPGDVTEVTYSAPPVVFWEHLPTTVRRTVHTFIKEHGEIAPDARFRLTGDPVEEHGIYVLHYRDEVSGSMYEIRVSPGGLISGR